MSPDEQSVLDTIAAAVRRTRIIALAEALAWGGAAAAIWLMASPPVLVFVLTWRLRASGRKAVVTEIERTHRGARNLFVTADELSRGVLSAKPVVRDRVFAHASLESQRLNLKTFAPILPFTRAASVAGAVWILVLTASLWRQPLDRLTGRGGSGSASSAAVGAAGLRVSVSLTPPGYTRLAPSSTVDPQQIAAVEGTVASLAIDGSAERVTVEHEGATRPLTRDGSGRFVDRIELRKTGYYAVETDLGARRVIPIVVSPDGLPAIQLTAPGRDLVYPRADRRVEFDVRASDDFGLRALGLEYTKVSGSGEQFEFQEGQIPFTLSKASDREWRGSIATSLAELTLEEGDILVYRAVATDARPGDGTARSDAFFIEISKLAAAAGDAFTVPKEETRYALSQQMLIIKTERLERTRSSMAAADFTEAVLDLAAEQRMIRAEFVFMLGGEVEDEDVEAQQSSELLEGRLQNRGQRDVRAATIAMSQAEKLLTGGNTREALTAERAAVAALQRAFARDRYILRALGSRTDLDLKRRLTGNLTEAAGGRRARLATRSNRRAALLQDLLAGIAALGNPSHASAANAMMLAREALRIDANSAALRKAAADLQRIADIWPETSPAARQPSIDAVSGAVATEVTQAMAASPARSTFVVPALAGGFADALRSGESK